jgi:hypothetical protein
MNLLAAIIEHVIIAAADKFLNGFLLTCGGIIAAKWFGVL